MTTRTISDRSFNSVQLSQAEAADLARLASRAYKDAVTFYQKEHGIAPVEADALARAPHWQTTEAPAHEVTWFGLETLLDADPSQAVLVWEKIKSEAFSYVESGQYAAEALRYRTPWERAQFFAVRAALYDGWQPQNGVERILLDTIAHAHCVYLYWAGEVQQRGTLRAENAPLLDQAAGMADRFNRLMVRTLRALRDLRRSGVVVVAQAGAQVNIGQQQVNAARMEVEGR